MPYQHILDLTLTHHNTQQTLCARLEAIADDLPHRVNRQECLLVARDLYPAVRAAHDFEENQLFPHLQGGKPSDDALSDGLERLRFEHWEDEAYAEEVCDALGKLGRGGDLSDAEKLAWMLRGFFDGVRRHIAFETEHLLPILKSLAEGRKQVLLN